LANLEELLKECQYDYRSTVLNVLDELWLDGREHGSLTVPQLNAINAATFELRVQWGLKGWHQAKADRSRNGQDKGTLGLVHESGGPDRDLPESPSPSSPTGVSMTIDYGRNPDTREPSPSVSAIRRVSGVKEEERCRESTSSIIASGATDYPAF
jgi:hypothetical protein